MFLHISKTPQSSSEILCLGNVLSLLFSVFGNVVKYYVKFSLDFLRDPGISLLQMNSLSSGVFRTIARAESALGYHLGLSTFKFNSLSSIEVD